MHITILLARADDLIEAKGVEDIPRGETFLNGNNIRSLECALGMVGVYGFLWQGGGGGSRSTDRGV